MFYVVVGVIYSPVTSLAQCLPIGWLTLAVLIYFYFYEVVYAVVIMLSPMFFGLAYLKFISDVLCLFLLVLLVDSSISRSSVWLCWIDQCRSGCKQLNH